MTNTYEYWKNKWDSGDFVDEFKNNLNFPALVDEDWILWNTNPDKQHLEYGDDYAHRLDGPAIIWADNAKTWYFYDEHITHKTTNGSWDGGPFYDWSVDQGMDIDNLTDEDKTLIKLCWG